MRNKRVIGMSKRLYWGLGVLIILFGTAFVVIMQRQYADIAELKEGLAESERLLEASKKPNNR